MVILIIALLMALLTNAVQSSREMGRRTQCLSKMRELGTAAIEFQSRNNGYPGWLHPVFGPAPPPPQWPPRYVNSWIYQLLPTLGRTDLTEKTLLPWSVGASFPPVLNDLLVCPTDAEKMSLRAPQSPTSYVCNAGRQDAAATASLPADWRSNAVFMNRDDLPGGSSVKVDVTDSSFIAKGDRLAFTLLLSENVDAGTWYNILVAPNPPETVNCIVFWPPDNSGQPPKLVHFINGVKDSTSTAYDLARPSSLHPGGVNMFFCGGNGRFVSDRMDYRIYCAIMTPREASAMDPGTNTLTFPSGLPKVTEESLQ